LKVALATGTPSTNATMPEPDGFELDVAPSMIVFVSGVSAQPKFAIGPTDGLRRRRRVERAKRLRDSRRCSS
jgi:hypothetical protein